MANAPTRTEIEEDDLQLPPRKKAVPGVVNQLPLTPMIDVTFQLLLYFLMTAQFRMDEGQIAGTVPQEGEAAVAPDLNNINIAIRPGWESAAGPFFEIQGVQFAGAQELYENLVVRPDKELVSVIIQPQGDVGWKYIVEAFNQAVRAKFQKVGFALANAK